MAGKPGESELFEKPGSEGKIAMRRILSLAAAGFGMYVLWYNNDQANELMGLGALGAALLLEFIGAD